MKQKKKVLWIEDGSRYDLADLAAPVIMDGGYDLDVAEDASEGIAKLFETEYDAVIVDIRIPPGNGEAWVKLYERSGKEKVSARLGRHFLYSILGHKEAEIRLDERPKWIKPEKIGVLSVESHLELNGDLNNLTISVYYQKQANTPEDILLTIIKDILNKEILE